MVQRDYLVIVSGIGGPARAKVWRKSTTSGARLLVGAEISLPTIAGYFEDFLHKKRRRSKLAHSTIAVLFANRNTIRHDRKAFNIERRLRIGKL